MTQLDHVPFVSIPGASHGIWCPQSVLDGASDIVQSAEHFDDGDSIRILLEESYRSTISLNRVSGSRIGKHFTPDMWWVPRFAAMYDTFRRVRNSVSDDLGSTPVLVSCDQIPYDRYPYHLTEERCDDLRDAWLIQHGLSLNEPDDTPRYRTFDIAHAYGDPTSRITSQFAGRLWSEREIRAVIRAILPTAVSSYASWFRGLVTEGHRWPDTAGIDGPMQFEHLFVTQRSYRNIIDEMINLYGLQSRLNRVTALPEGEVCPVPIIVSEQDIRLESKLLQFRATGGMTSHR